MSSQFVDIDADGRLDYLAAIFDGSPHVAFGAADGFRKPAQLLDRNGKRIIINYYWDYVTKAHEVDGRSLGKTERLPNQRCISALAYDWDADGDLDLLLGSYEEGRLYRQMNEGSATSPKFTGSNIPVMAGDVPFSVPGKMTSPRLVDWDGDGDLDLLAGSFGGHGENVPGGAVYLSLNRGREGDPAFGPLETVIEADAKAHTQPTRPDRGLYVDALDHDGDGDLDLIVGGYSEWKPAPRKLSADERRTVEKLRAKLADNRKQMDRFFQKQRKKMKEATAGLESGSEEWRKRRREVSTGDLKERRKLSTERSELSEQLQKLAPEAQSKSFVWFYERRS